MASAGLVSWHACQMGRLKLRRPRAILFDLTGTATRESFVGKVLMPYFRANAKSYLEQNWAKCRAEVEALASVAKQDPESPQVDPCGGQSEQVESIAAYLRYCEQRGRESKALAKLRLQVWFHGYDSGALSTPLYPDVAVNLRKWHERDIRLFLLSNGWAEATRKFMCRTSDGDLNPLISRHFDTSTGSLTSVDTYRKVASEIGEQPEDVLFLTKCADQARVARQCGITPVLVLSRKGDESGAHQYRDFQVVGTFAELQFT